jgi:hypothetical protein
MRTGFQLGFRRDWGQEGGRLPSRNTQCKNNRSIKSERLGHRSDSITAIDPDGSKC